MAVSYLYAFVILVLIFASSLAVEVKEGLPHTAFGDLDDDRLTSSLHKTFTVEELAKYGGQNVRLLKRLKLRFFIPTDHVFVICF